MEMGGGEGMPDYIHIDENEFTHRKHRKQKEADIAICECEHEAGCGDTCLNLLTSTECTPHLCPCGPRCNNQRFQRCQYAATAFFHTQDRGWGLRAAEDIKAGQFIIEYCGQLISSNVAQRRSQAYQLQGVRDAFIISLSALESIDATKKGSLARFINHSCQPNCETRKWNVLGEVRVGIFAKHDIPSGTELSYNYNFQWYGGAKVRCLCGAPNCCGFLGAKSRGFQEDTYLWEDDDDRYSVEKIPLYDSAEDEPSTKLSTTITTNLSTSEYNGEERMENAKADFEHEFLSTALVVQSLDTVPMEIVAVKETKAESDQHSPHAEEAYPQKNAMISPVQTSSSASRKHQSGPRSKPKKRSKKHSNGRLKSSAQNQVDAKSAALLLPSKEAKDEVLRLEELKNEAASQLECLYDEIRPAIEEHERDSQDSVATSVAEKWIEASCMKLKAEFDLYYSIVKNIPIAKPFEATVDLTKLF